MHTWLKSKGMCMHREVPELKNHDRKPVTSVANIIFK